MRKLKLDLLRGELLGITKNRGGSWYEAILIALAKNEHSSGIVINLSGDVKEKAQLIWKEQLEQDAMLNWNDLTELAEEAATGIALLLIREFTPYKVSWRA